ncbi:sensor histidine kinase [Nocardia sp. IBHARD005]|uniref:sensor histidine kinase n=1 Tax=Nocardia sp. IBHARD005 TaxID=3457765 RepID=UPI00405A2B9A
MSLAKRLTLALIALTLTMLAAGGAVVVIQRHYLVQQLDTRLSQLAANPLVPLLLSQQTRQVNRFPPAFGDIYLGIRNADGTLTTVQAPPENPNVTPNLQGARSLPVPTGLPTTGGAASEMRVMTIESAGATAVIGISAQNARDATRQLILALTAAGVIIGLVVGAVVWWVHRLGLAPIARMTEAADAIAAGATDRRVEAYKTGTEAARLGQALNTMIDAIQATEDRMRRFVADASHELRTPLTTLRGYSALYSSGGSLDTDGVQDAMRRINDEARRMAGIVEALLDLNDLDEHGIADRVLVDIVPLVTAVVDDLRVIQPERGIHLETPRSRCAEAVPDRVIQAVLSLATNALRHTPSDAAITIRVIGIGDSVRISVEDTGPGIAPEHLPHLFDRFYRADSGRARSRGGNGLGLAIVAAIMHAHKGTFGVDAQPGRGSSFWIEFPRNTPGLGGAGQRSGRIGPDPVA